MAAPPFEGALHVSVAWVFPAVAARSVTADGTVVPEVGVALATLEVEPVPTEFTALTRKSYDRPFVNPVTVAPVAVLVPSLNTVNIPPDCLNSTM